jgi:hypothetical protein
MPRKAANPDEIFTVTKIYEPDRQAELKALRIVMNAGSKKKIEEAQKLEKGA